MKKSKKIVLPLAGPLAGIAVLAAAGCQPSSNAERLYVSSYGSSSVYAYAGGHRDLKTEIVGNPFGGSADATATKVMADMAGADEGVGARYTTTPGPSAVPGYKVVMVFDPSAGTTDHNACSNAASNNGSGGGGIKVLAVFCTSDGTYTASQGSLPAGTALNDPTVRRLVRDLVSKLVPVERVPSW